MLAEALLDKLDPATALALARAHERRGGAESDREATPPRPPEVEDNGAMCVPPSGPATERVSGPLDSAVPATLRSNGITRRPS